MRPGVAPRTDEDRERILRREAGKDEARAFLLNMVRGKMPRKSIRERLLAAKALLYEKADLSHTDDTAETLRQQQDKFDSLMAAVRGADNPSDSKNTDGDTPEPAKAVGE